MGSNGDSKDVSGTCSCCLDPPHPRIRIREAAQVAPQMQRSSAAGRKEPERTNMEREEHSRRKLQIKKDYEFCGF